MLGAGVIIQYAVGCGGEIRFFDRFVWHVEFCVVGEEGLPCYTIFVIETAGVFGLEVSDGSAMDEPLELFDGICWGWLNLCREY
jgi:hypothetical protein